jgi:ribonuclease BN (tRNA processing enzyme)
MTLNNRMMDGVFPVSFQDLSARIEPGNRLGHGPLQVGDTVVEAIETQHPQGGMGFRFREGTRTLVFLTDNELKPDAWPGRAPSDFAHFCRGAQLLIHDGQYRPDEMPGKRGWGHSDCLAAVDLAVEADVERLILTHHDPDRTDQAVEEMVSMARERAASRGRADLSVEAGCEGQTLRV